MVPLRLAWAIQDPELAAAVQYATRGLPVRLVLQVEDFHTLARQVRTIRPDVALIQVTEIGVLPDWVARLKTGPGQPAVFVVDKSAESGTILAAFRAGADEFLYPPLEDNLRQALERESERRRLSDESGPQGKILAFLSVKGGCGATTLACGSALELARLRPRGAALLDLDFTAGLAGFLMGARSPYSALDAIAQARRLDLNYWSKLVADGPEGLDVLPSRPCLGLSRASDPEALRHVLRFARTRYAFTVADLGSCVHAAILPACEESDLLFLVTTIDVLALYRCVTAIRNLEENGVERSRLRLVPNQVAETPAMSVAELEKAVGMPVEAMIPEDAASVARWHGGQSLPNHGKLCRALAALAARASGTAGPARPAAPGLGLWRAAFALVQPSRRNA